MSIIKAIRANDKMIKARKWDRSYWFIDIHGTMIKPNWDKENLPKEFYPYAVDVLKILTARPEIILCLYTCSWPKEIEEYKKLFDEHGIVFNYINVNPEVTSSGYGCFDQKPYINVLMDDKAGFDPEQDWFILKRHFMIKYRMMPGLKFLGWIYDGITNFFKRITKKAKNEK